MPAQHICHGQVFCKYLLFWWACVLSIGIFWRPCQAATWKSKGRIPGWKWPRSHRLPGLTLCYLLTLNTANTQVLTCYANSDVYGVFFPFGCVCVFLSLPYNVKKRKVWKQEQMCEKVIKTHICTCICHCQLESKLQIDYGVQKIWWHILHVFLSLHSVLAEHLPNLTVIALCIRFHQQGYGRIFEYIHSVDKIHTKRWLYLVTHHWLNLTYNEVLLIVQIVG